MKINKDSYNLSLLKDGTPVDIIRRNSSIFYVSKLVEHQLINLHNEKVYLTQKGKVAKKIGLKCYLEAQEFENEISVTDSESNSDNQFYISCLSLSLLVLYSILIYIIIVLN